MDRITGKRRYKIVVIPDWRFWKKPKFCLVLQIEIHGLVYENQDCRYEDYWINALPEHLTYYDLNLPTKDKPKKCSHEWVEASDMPYVYCNKCDLNHPTASFISEIKDE